MKYNSHKTTPFKPKPHCNFLKGLSSKIAQKLKEKEKRWNFNFVKETPMVLERKIDHSEHSSEQFKL